MTFKITCYLGAPGFTEVDTVAKVPLGTIVKGSSQTLGEGEFIYLLGVASTVLGDVVRYNAATFQTVRLVNTAVQAMPVAVAMAAIVAARYGWYQITGQATMKKTAVIIGPNVPVFISATAGSVKALASAGLQIVACRTQLLSTLSAAGTVLVTISRPHCQSQIT